MERPSAESGPSASCEGAIASRCAIVVSLASVTKWRSPRRRAASDAVHLEMTMTFDVEFPLLSRLRNS